MSLHWAFIAPAAAPSRILHPALNSSVFPFSSAALVRSSAGVNSCHHFKDAVDLHKQVVWFQVVLLLYENGFSERPSSVNV